MTAETTERAAGTRPETVRLDKQIERSRGPWVDAGRRLIRHRAALLGLAVILVFVLVAIFAPHLTQYTYEKQNYTAINTAPDWVIDLFPKMTPVGEDKGYVRVDNDYLLGTDALGRDLWTRIIFGARISLAVAFIGPLTSLVVGTIYGMVSGYIGGRTDNILMRLVDVMYAFHVAADHPDDGLLPL